MPTLKTATLGCKVNQYETQLVREGLESAGYRVDDADTPADLCVVNTCTVTREGDSKSRQVIRRLARENPDSRIVVMGCYATRDPQAIASLPNVVEVVTDKREIPDLLGRFGVVDPPDGISAFGDRHRAFVKVQDGCLLRCSYCIIPHVRPQLSSRPVDHILDEVRRLSANGYREVVLTGIHLGHYGVDQNRGKPKSEWLRLSHLLARLIDMPGDFRIRLSSIEAPEITRELIDVMQRGGERVCPHLHVCLQSGSDRILRRMRRRWSTRMFLDRCQLVRDRLSDVGLTTDIIVGFPGETDEDFDRTRDVARRAGFAKIHAFPFSARRGTPAASMDDQIDKATKTARVHQLGEIERHNRAQLQRQLLGKSLRVLAESTADRTGYLTGTSCRYLPVEFPGEPRQLGDILEVVPTAIHGDRLIVAEG